MRAICRYRGLAVCVFGLASLTWASSAQSAQDAEDPCASLRELGPQEHYDIRLAPGPVVAAVDGRLVMVGGINRADGSRIIASTYHPCEDNWDEVVRSVTGHVPDLSEVWLRNQRVVAFDPRPRGTGAEPPKGSSPAILPGAIRGFVFDATAGTLDLIEAHPSEWRSGGEQKITGWMKALDDWILYTQSMVHRSTRAQGFVYDTRRRRWSHTFRFPEGNWEPQGTDGPRALFARRITSEHQVRTEYRVLDVGSGVFGGRKRLPENYLPILSASSSLLLGTFTGLRAPLTLLADGVRKRQDQILRFPVHSEQDLEIVVSNGMTLAAHGCEGGRRPCDPVMGPSRYRPRAYIQRRMKLPASRPPAPAAKPPVPEPRRVLSHPKLPMGNGLFAIPPLEEGEHTSVTSISNDGRVVGGMSASPNGLIGVLWKPEGVVTIREGGVSALSGDGKTAAVGNLTKTHIWRDNRVRAFASGAVYDFSADGMVAVGASIVRDVVMWQDEARGRAEPRAVAQRGTMESAHGICDNASRTVGTGYFKGERRAFVYDAEQSLWALPSGHDGGGSRAFDISGDCQVVVGITSGTAGQRGALWRDGKVLQLDQPDDTVAVLVYATNGDGSVTGGTIMFERQGTTVGVAAIWDAKGRYRFVAEVAAAAGMDTTGWELRDVIAMSSDGLTLVGNGARDGKSTGWILRRPP